MLFVRLASLLSCMLALVACSRHGEPPPGPTPAKSLAQPSASVAEQELAAAPGPHTSVHDRDMPDKPPPRPPSDNATLIKASHILIAYQGAQDAAPGVKRDKETAKKLAGFVALEARAGADFETLVAKYSDDPQAQADQGRLGQISRSHSPKPFTDAAFALMVKEITPDPVETALGFHIIKRTE